MTSNASSFVAMNNALGWRLIKADTIHSFRYVKDVSNPTAMAWTVVVSLV